MSETHRRRASLITAGVSMANANLSFTNLSKANLRGANLKGANLRKAKIIGIKPNNTCMYLNGVDLSIL